ncbi:hypothetical protein ABCL16_003453 [Vibrio parahaemolyticus]
MSNIPSNPTMKWSAEHSTIWSDFLVMTEQFASQGQSKQELSTTQKPTTRLTTSKKSTAGKVDE